MCGHDERRPNGRPLLRHFSIIVLLNESPTFHQHDDSRAIAHARGAREHVKKTKILVRAKKLVKGCRAQVGRFGGMII